MTLLYNSDSIQVSPHMWSIVDSGEASTLLPEVKEFNEPCELSDTVSAE